MSNALKLLWQHQEPALKKMSVEEFRRKADQALADDRRYKLVAGVTAGLIIACFVVFLFGSPTTMGRIGAAVGIGAGLAMAYRAYRLLATHPLLPGAAGIEAYRRILEREQMALTICWQTMLLIQIGVALQFAVGVQLLAPSDKGAKVALTVLATIGPVIVVALMTRAKAQAYGRRARELETPKS